MADKYIVSARKYRPDSFKTIVGQEAVSSTLKTAVINQKVAHAYLFCGPRGVGKTTAARVLAKTINCENRQTDGEACNTCESCQAFEQQRSYNIFELDAASNNGVDDIRNLTEQVATPPAYGKYKVYIIDEVHMLSQAGFNAFLKTLEEPPAYAIFILATTERHKILPTILSRCQIFDFKRIGMLDIIAHLNYVAKEEGIKTDDAALALIAEKADGGMRDALSIFDRIASFSENNVSYQSCLSCLNLLDYTDYIKIIELLLTNDYRGVMLLLNNVLSRGFDELSIIQGFSKFVRDLMMAQFPNTQILLEKPDSVQEQYVAISKRCATKTLHLVLKDLLKAEQDHRYSANKRLLLEMTFLNLLPHFQEYAFMTGVRLNSSSEEIDESIGGSVESKKKNDVAEATPVVKEVKKVIVEAKTTNTPTVNKATLRRKYLLRGEPIPEELLDDKEEAEELAEEHQTFSQEDLERTWLAFRELELKAEDRMLAVLMKEEYPKIIEGAKLELAVIDVDFFQEQYAGTFARLIRYLKQTLHNTDIHIDLVAKSADEIIKHPITREEREQAMMKTNPALKYFKEKFDLR